MTSTETTTAKTNHYYLRVLVALALAASFLLVVLAAKPAHAAFPGANGKIAFVSTRDGNRNIYTMNPDGSNVTPVTVGPFVEEDPTISPDGKTIAFTRKDVTGNVDIYVKPLNDPGANDNLLVSTGGSDIKPTWSPDGTKIAFVSNRDGNVDLYVVSSDIFASAQPTHLTDDAAVDTDPVFSPDGKKIAFTSTRDGNFNIYKMNADGSSERRLTKNKAGNLEPSFSPNGKKIAFMSARDGISAEIFVMNAKDGSRPRNVTKNAAADFAPDWGVAAQE